MSDSPFKLADVKEPKFRFSLPPRADQPEPEIREVDPWEVSEKLAALPVGTAEGFDLIRQAFGFKPATHGDVVAGEYTPSRGQCVALQAALLEFVSELDSVKKVQALSQKF